MSMARPRVYIYYILMYNILGSIFYLPDVDIRTMVTTIVQNMYLVQYPIELKLHDLLNLITYKTNDYSYIVTT